MILHKVIIVVTFVILITIGIGCTTDQPRVIVITSMPNPTAEVVSTATTVATITPESIPTQIITDQSNPTGSLEQYTVQGGDTLSQIAEAYNVSLEALINVNQLANPNLLEVGQVLILPAPPTTFTPDNIIIPDTKLVRSPDSIGFDIVAFVNNTSGYIKSATDTVETRLADGSIRGDILSATSVIKRVSSEYSIDERLLLSLLEYKARWLSEPNLSQELVDYPLISESESGGFDRKGLYKQLSWLANELNRGFYSAKYRSFDVLSFDDGTQFLYNQSANAGTLALQYVLSLNNTISSWSYDVSSDGFQAIYSNLFGFDANNISNVATVIPDQPELMLPFRQGDIWRFTGGFHGGWGSGSAWSALDFAPPDDRENGDPFCYISEYPVTAVADGTIANISDGALVLDLDKDSDDRTGWTILYLHMTIDSSITEGQVVSVGDTLGYASCHGGFSSATHLHIARRYNGEWVPADCNGCTNVTPFIMGQWQAVGLVGQEYQGFMVNSTTNQRVVAEQGRNTKINEISW